MTTAPLASGPVVGKGTDMAQPFSRMARLRSHFWVQMATLISINFSQSVMLTLPFTLSVYMVRRFEQNSLAGEGEVDEGKVSRLTGLLAAVFSFAQFLTSVLWGAASNILGRKAVIVIGTAVSFISLIWYGVATSYQEAVVARVVGGLLNGILGAWKCIIGETGDTLLQGKMFAYMSVAWGLGTTLGPLIGGLLARPCERFSGLALCAPGQLLYERPFALPCLVGSSTLLLSGICTMCLLNETLPDSLRQQQLASLKASAGGLAACMSRACSCCCGHRSSHLYRSLSLEDVEQPASQLLKQAASGQPPVMVGGAAVKQQLQLTKVVNSSSQQGDSATAGAERQRLLGRCSGGGLSTTASSSSLINTLVQPEPQLPPQPAGSSHPTSQGGHSDQEPASSLGAACTTASSPSASSFVGDQAGPEPELLASTSLQAPEPVWLDAQPMQAAAPGLALPTAGLPTAAELAMAGATGASIHQQGERLVSSSSRLGALALEQQQQQQQQQQQVMQLSQQRQRADMFGGMGALVQAPQAGSQQQQEPQQLQVAFTSAGGFRPPGTSGCQADLQLECSGVPAAVRLPFHQPLGQASVAGTEHGMQDSQQQQQQQPAAQAAAPRPPALVITDQPGAAPNHPSACHSPALQHVQSPLRSSQPSSPSMRRIDSVRARVMALARSGSRMYRHPLWNPFRPQQEQQGKQGATQQCSSCGAKPGVKRHDSDGQPLLGTQPSHSHTAALLQPCCSQCEGSAGEGPMSPVTPLHQHSEDKPAADTQTGVLPWHHNPNVVRALMGYAFVSFLYCAIDEIIPIFAAAPVQEGGLGLTEPELAPPITLYGVALMVYSAWGYPALQQLAGTLPLTRYGLLTAIVTCLVLPLAHTALAASSALCKATLFVAMVIKSFAQCSSFTGALVMVNAAPHKAQLGAVNGVGQTLASLVRGLGPALGGLLWALSMELGCDGQQFFPFLVTCLLAVAAVRVYARVSLPNLK